MKNGLLGIFIFLCCLMSAPVFSANRAPYTSIEDFLKNQKTIRIYAVAVGGYGHLSATANMMNHIRQQFNYTGWYEVVYPKMDRSQVSIIFNLPKDIPDVYEDKKNNLRFVTLEEQIRRYHTHTIEPVELGLSAAADDEDASCIWTGMPLDKSDTNMCQNFAKLLNVKIYTSVTHDTHPSTYTGSLFQRGDEFFLPNESKLYLVNEKGTYFLAPTSTLTDSESYLAKEGKDLLVKLPALQTFIDHIKNQNSYIMPVYASRTIKDEAEMDKTVANVLQIITGAREAQLSQYDDKPLIIAVFHDYQKESAQIQQIIASSLQYSSSDLLWIQQAKKVIQTVKLNQPNTFFIASLSDPNTISLMGQLKPRQVLLLSVGSLPKIVFDGIYTYPGGNMWPQVREGYGTLSNILLSGKAHFRCGDFRENNWDVGYDFIKDFSLKIRMKVFYAPNNHFCDGLHTWEKNKDIYKSFSQFIKDSHNTQTTFAQYFEVLKNEASKPSNDRVRDMLTKVVQFENGDLSGLGNNRFDPPQWEPIKNRFAFLKTMN